MEKYDLVIGLEVHAQLLTESKMFCKDSTGFGAQPNSQISVISLGHPGTLPKTNRKAVEFAIRMGLACDCEINRFNFFDRKNYFYPDLPKGYQISQDKAPICKGGKVKIRLKTGEERFVQLNRIHLEEDAGKSIHLAGETDTLIDLNRAGMPLIELVTEPDLHSADEAHAFLSEIRKLVQYLDICDGNLEEGSLRCDANISVKPKGSDVLGKKVEIKNMNSFRNVHRAIQFEWKRQTDMLETGEEVISETRMFDAEKGETYSMRSKETMNDYRYFPEPDLQPIVVSEEWLREIKSEMPSLPDELYQKFIGYYQLPEYDAAFLTDSKEVAVFFESLCELTPQFKIASNWIMGPIQSYLNDSGQSIENLPFKADKIASIISMIDSGKVSHSAASQRLLPALFENPGENPENLVERLNLFQNSDEAELQLVVDKVLGAMPDKVMEYKKGKKALIGLFMGEVKKATQGKADPKLTGQLLEKSLS